MDRDADRPRLVSNRTGDGLSDPPGGIGAELVPPLILEFVHRLHEADVAFLNQVQKLQPAVGVFFGDADDQPQVRFDQFRLPPLHLLLSQVEVTDDFLDLIG